MFSFVPYSILSLKCQLAAWQPRSRSSRPRVRDHEIVNTSTRGKNVIWVKGQMTLTSQIGYILFRAKTRQNTLSCLAFILKYDIVLCWNLILTISILFDLKHDKIFCRNLILITFLENSYCYDNNVVFHTENISRPITR